MTGCFPERVPTDPDYEAQDMRRPAVKHHVPLSGAVGVNRSTEIILWFDELMDEESVDENFKVWPYTKVDSILTIAFNPQEPDVIYAGKLSQGIFKSTDTGESWQWITSDTPRMTVCDIIVDPANSEVIYAATNSGVYKSSDAGTSWTTVNNGLSDLSIKSIAIDPNSSDFVYVTTGSEGVFKSVDGGLNWESRNNGINIGRPIFDIVINPSNSDVLYVATEGSFILRSTDGSENWTRLRTGLSTRDFYVLVIHPSDGDIVYAGSVSGGIYRSGDAGDNWTNISSGLGNQAIHDIVVDPSDTNVVIVGTKGGIYKSSDGGLNWASLGEEWASAGVEAVEIHPDNAEFFFVGGPDGMYKSMDGGTIWEKRTNLILDNILINGSFLFEDWRDSTTIIAPLDSVTIDTTVIFPYIIERALVAWIASGRKGEPPVEADPTATKMVFTPGSLLPPSTKIQVRVQGTFESDRETPQDTLWVQFGARDFDGNSLEINSNFTFTTGED